MRDFQDIEDATYNYGVDDPRLTEGDILRVPDSVLYPVFNRSFLLSLTVQPNCKHANMPEIIIVISHLLLLIVLSCMTFVKIISTCRYTLYNTITKSAMCLPCDGRLIAAISLTT